MSALVSVIIPVYNGEAFLREAIESVLAQTLTPHEIIVVDDGSTDTSGEIARSLPVTYLRIENQGVSTARNHAIEHATGDCFALLDADDVWMPDKLRRQLMVLEKEPQIGLVSSRFVPIGTAPVSQDMFLNPPLEKAGTGLFVPSTWLITREAWLKVGVFNPGRKLGEDLHWLTRAGEAGISFRMLDDLLVYKRNHASQLTTGQSKNHRRNLLRMVRESMARRGLTTHTHGERPKEL